MQMNVLTDFFAQVGDDHEKKSHFVIMVPMPRAGRNQLVHTEETENIFVVFCKTPMSVKVFLSKKMTFFRKKVKKKFLFLRLSVTMS